MANRHLARSVVLQSLFELDSDSTNAVPQDVFLNNVQEFAPEQSIFPFMQQLFDLVRAKQKDIDLIIVKAAPEWPLDKIAIVDRNILRIGLAELLFSDKDQVPPKVAINEAIELAKEFSGEPSGRFVNGVLGAVYRELDTGTTTQKKGEEKKIPIEDLIGAVVYAQEDDIYYIALVHDVFGHWTLPKGKLNSEERLELGVQRKVKEELGLDVIIQENLGENEYVASDPTDGKKKRHATYFMAQAQFTDLHLKKEGGLDDAKWFKMIDIVDLNFYDDVLPIITNAVNVLVAKK